jgi:F-type H+-transporting ATPase subunit b
MIHLYFAAEEHAGGAPLGLSLKAFLIQLITFVLVFLLLKRFAFKPIISMLEKRRRVIEDGIRLGEEMEKEKAALDERTELLIRDARHEADRIINNAQKDAREVVREAEKVGQKRVDAMVMDAEARIVEETQQARRKLEKDIVGLVSEATEAIVEEKVDAKKDADLIDKAIKDRNKS